MRNPRKVRKIHRPCHLKIDRCKQWLSTSSERRKKDVAGGKNIWDNSTMSINRPQISIEIWLKVIDEVRLFMQKKLEEHGQGACVSLHEIRGLVGEEWDEFKACVHQNDTGHAREELLDLIVSAIWGIVSIDAQVATDDWDSGEKQ